jgi:hypothetical protein
MNVDWITLVQNRGQLWTIVCTVMKLRVQYYGGEFRQYLRVWTIGFSSS